MTTRRDILAGATALGALAAVRASASAPANDSHWDRIPLYGHLGKAKGDFTPAEIDFIVRHYPIVTIEKSQGIGVHGSTEAGSAVAHKAIKAADPATKTLFYWNGFIDYGRIYAASRGGLPADFYLHGLDGKVDESRPGAPRYDLSNPKLRKWWVETAMRQVDGVGYDGVWIDAMPQVAARREAGVKRLGAAKQQAIEDGAMAMFADLRAAMGKRLIHYNGVRSLVPGWSDGGMRFLKYADGAMLEHFDFSESGTPERMAGDMELIAKTDALGKAAVFKAWPDFTFLDREKMKQPVAALRDQAQAQITFPLAAFLCCAGSNSWLHYSWGYRENQGQLETYAEYGKRLGAPLGPATRHGFKYARQFAHASVAVDLATKRGKVDWK